jgi:uncharacterized protein (UPF0333 family)
MNTNGQGAIEYLLIIGAAVIIAVIVIAFMMGLTQEGTNVSDEAGIEDTFIAAQCQKDCSYTNDTMAEGGKTCSDYYDGCE